MSTFSNYLILLTLMFGVSCSNSSNIKVINSNKLLERNGIYYLINQTEPFTGIAADSSYGRRTSLFELSEGKLNGILEMYYETGQIEIKGEMTNGFRSGEWIQYYDNGQVESIGKYLEGSKSGEWIQYYENGQIYTRGEYFNGLEQNEWEIK